MPLTSVEGDLFELGLPAIGHGCNCQGAMGAGIAVEFRRRHPEMYRAHRAMCLAGEYQLGDIFVWAESDVVIYNLATQPVPQPSATVAAIGQSVARALDDAAGRGIDRLGVPRLGAGLGGLRWPDVEATLHAVADEHAVELVVVSRPPRHPVSSG